MYRLLPLVSIWTIGLNGTPKYGMLAYEGGLEDNPQLLRGSRRRSIEVRRSNMPATQTSVLPDHVLAAVLTLAKQQFVAKDPGQRRFAFLSHDFQLQEIFNDLRRTNKYPILDAFVFSDSGPEPYSPALSESVSRLQLSGLIGRENPDYEVVFLRPAADRFFNDVLKSEFESQSGELAAIASEFLKRVKVVPGP